MQNLAGGSIGRDPTSLSETSGGFTFVASQTMSPAGFIGGGQLGYNYQYAPNWVIGIEGDFQGASQRDSLCINLCGNPAPVDVIAINITQKVEWFATLRARLGYTNGDWLWYVTGGGAWAQVHNDLTLTGSAGPGGPTVSVDSSGSFNQSGWTVGGGVETHLVGNWTAKLEYLYMDLGSINAGPVSVTIPTPTSVTQTSDIRDHIVRAGLNYKFY